MAARLGLVGDDAQPQSSVASMMAIAPKGFMWPNVQDEP
jgi:hypothetical protein